MNWPDEVMIPGPLFGSPPETDQVTGARLPSGRVAVNCSTGLPCAPVALQPVQLVSIETVPGEMEKLFLEGPAMTPPPAQPAITRRKGTIRLARTRLCNLTPLIGPRKDHNVVFGRSKFHRMVVPKRGPSGGIPVIRAIQELR